MSFSQIYCRVGYWKNFENWLIFNKLWPRVWWLVFLTHGVVYDKDKYQLSLNDPRDESCCSQSLTITVTNYSVGAWRYCQLSWPATDCPVYHAVSVHFRRAKSITRFDDRYTKAKVRSFEQVSRRKCPHFWRYATFLLTQCKIGGRKLACQKPARFIHPFR